MSAQSSITGLYGIRHSPLLLLTLAYTHYQVICMQAGRQD